MTTPFTLSGKPIKFSPVSFADDEGRPKAEFTIGQWTDADLDRLEEILFTRGIILPTMEDQRALMVNELFSFYDEEEAERRANLLDEFWQDSDRLREAMDGYQERDLERRRDEGAGAPAIQPEVPPRSMLSIRTRAEVQTIATDLQTKSDKLRALLYASKSYTKRSIEAMVRMSLLGWNGLETKFQAVDGMVTEDCFRALCNELGSTAYGELRGRISRGTSVDKDELGNSDSPASGSLEESSSPEPNGASESSAGNSTTSSTAPAQAGGSGEITPE